MSEPCDLSAVEARRLIGAKKLSPVELMSSCLARIEATNKAVNAVVAMIDERAARKAAKAAEQAVMRGEDLGLLHGLPIGVKDLQDTAGLRTTYGSLLYKDHVPKDDNTTIARIRSEGGIILCKTNTPEFGAGSNTTNRVYGPTGNPFDPKLNAGGSLAEVAVEFGGTIVPTPPFKRLGTTPGVPAAVQQRAFGLAKGTSDSVVSADGKSRTIIRVLELFAAPDARPDQLEQLKAELGRQLQSDALNAYISGLRDAQGMTVNEAAFKRVTGTAETQ